MERIFETARVRGIHLPHYFYTTNNGWKTNGPLEANEFETQGKVGDVGEHGSCECDAVGWVGLVDEVIK
jgi:hypothetical protein